MINNSFDEHGKRKFHVTPLRFVIFVIFILLSGVGAYVSSYYLTGLMEGKSNSNNADNLLTDTKWRDYTSTKYGFKIQFPGLATAKDSTQTVDGTAINSTEYSRNNGDIYYIVGAIDYPAKFDLSDVDARLEGGLNGGVQNTTGAKLISSNFTVFNGYRALNGIISAPKNGKNYTLYTIIFLKGNILYMLSTVGAPKSDYEKFIASFRFI